MKNIVKVMVVLVLVGSVAYGNSLPPTPEYCCKMDSNSGIETLTNI